ncbi:MAG: hypothetical protein JWO13_1015 [Acidobacteriales bacterium]|nr:hypothetical protein [Terriglobales bacterium]
MGPRAVNAKPCTAKDAEKTKLGQVANAIYLSGLGDGTTEVVPLPRMSSKS